ncbi:MAG: NUDIX domain-containing protein [Anaerovoracaceae bacterium]|jgi:ADP-ribose pyrophosphatase
MIVEEKTLQSERIYEGKILNLRRDKVTVRSGTSYREIVEHNGGVAVAAITEDNKIVMVRQYRKTMERVVLEVPAGKREAGEEPLETVNRELREETGYTAENVELLTVMEPSVGYTTETLYIYLATGLRKGERDLDENEAIDVVEYDFREIAEKTAAGELRDGKTIVAVMLAAKKMGIL